MCGAPTLLDDQNEGSDDPSSDKDWTPIWYPLEWEFLGTREVHPRDTLDPFYILGIYACCGNIRHSWPSAVEILLKRGHAENGDERAHH